MYGLAGLRDGEPIHWSHMLGVREDVRGMGVGRHLKEMQRADARAARDCARALDVRSASGAERAPQLQSAGRQPGRLRREHVRHHASPLHLGLATDRLVVMLPPTAPSWGSGRRGTALSHVSGSVPVLTPFPRAGDIQVDLDDTAVPHALIEIPADLHQVIATTPDVAGTWRLATRANFQRALRRGYQVTGLRRDLTTNRAFFTLVTSSTGRHESGTP